MYNKKGDVWISAVLYFGLGIVVLSILLAAGLPVINKLRDKNVIIQTKQIMHELDQNIREVVKEGPGSQRVVTVNIKKGSFIVDEVNSMIIWEYNGSKVLISDPGIDVPEGKLNIRTDNAPQKNTYNVRVFIDYKEIAKLARPQGKTSTLVGINDLVIRNQGVDPQNPKVVTVSVTETNK